MKKLLTSYSLVAIQVASLVGSPIVHSFPVLTYSGTQDEIDFVDRPNSQAELSTPIYFHIYRGVIPDDSYEKRVEREAKNIDSSLNLIRINAQDKNGAKYYRLLIGPVSSDRVSRYSQLLKDSGIDNFPVYFDDTEKSVIDGDLYADKTEEVKSFEYSEEISEVARTVTTVGNSEDHGQSVLDATESYLLGKAQSELNTRGQAWLSQYGTAKVDFNLGDNVVSDADLELLVPFFTQRATNGQGASTFFVQSGLLVNSRFKYNDRDFAHIGFGYRQKSALGLYGINAFYDHDLQRDHQRGSLGLEYSISGIRLAGNYYFPISDWVTSNDNLTQSGLSTNIRERPAKGYDLHYKGYLPSLPWFFIDGSFQRFLGDHVETIKGDKTVSDLYVVDTAVNFQPVPLLTFKAGYEYEKDGYRDAKFSLDVTYRFGVPLQKQLDMDQVGYAQSLQTQLFDLVNREHNIRLEYQENAAPVSVSLASNTLNIQQNQTIDIFSGVNPLVNLTGDLTEIDRVTYSGNAAEFILNAGANDQNYLNDRLRSPSFVSNGENAYSLGVTVHMKSGQTIQSSQMLRIMVSENAVNVGLSQPGVSSSEEASSTIGKVSEGGVRISTTMRDQFGNPVSGGTVRFATTVETASFESITGTNANSIGSRAGEIEVQTDADGVARAMLSSKVAGTVPYIITSGGFSQQGSAVFQASAADVKRSTITVSETALEIGGTTRVTLKLNDQWGKPFTPTDTVSFKGYKGSTALVATDGVTIGSLTTTPAGTYSALITAAKTITGLTFKPSIGTNELDLTSPSITVTEGAVDKTKSSAISFVDRVVKDTAHNATFTLKNKNGANILTQMNPLPSIKVFVGGAEIPAAHVTIGNTTFAAATGLYTIPVTIKAAAAATSNAQLRLKVGNDTEFKTFTFIIP